MFGAGVFAAMVIDGLQVEDCSFSAPEASTLPFSTLAGGGTAEPPFQVRFGYLQVPTPGTPDAAAPATPALLTLANARFERNVFDGLTVPVLVIGRIGTTRIDDNTVRSCYGGLQPRRERHQHPRLDRPVRSGDAAAWKILVAQGLTALADPILLIATVIGRTLPAAPAAEGADIPGGVIVEPSPAVLAGALNLFQPLFTAAAATATAAPATTAVAAEPTEAFGAAETTAVGAAGAGAEVELPADITHMFIDPGVVDTANAVPTADPGTAVVPRLEISANQIDAVIADSDSGAGLFVLATDVADRSALICNGNRIRSRVPMGATVSLQLLVDCTVIGNIVSNEIVGDKQTQSISLNPRVIQQSVVGVAVTGNVLLGQARLPTRPLPAPLDVWESLSQKWRRRRETCRGKRS